MLTTKFILHTAAVSLKCLAIVTVLAACLSPLTHAETATVNQVQETATDAKLNAAVENLADIQKSIESKQKLVRELREKLKKSEDISEKQEIEQKIARIKFDISGLQLSFEHIALGGINRSILNEQPEQPINWQEELEQISRPLLSTLKELTAKPRQVDSLQRDIKQLEAQIKVIDKALESLRFFRDQTLPAMTVDPLKQLLAEWEQRGDDTQRKLEISQLKLDSLKNEADTWQTSTGELITEFLHGRGLTLLLAIFTSLIIWLTFKGSLSLYWRWRYQAKQHAGIIQAPLLYYSYRLATVTIIVLAVLTVFYIRGDVLLLTLALIMLAGTALALRQTLPRYTAEIRLLLGVGPVRENERLVLNGIPFKVESLSVYSELRNPALEGFVRLPLHVMDEHVSRPSRKETWFPCQPGDFVLLASGSLARVIRQTIELVEVAVMDSLMQIRTRDFIEQNIRNLSREGFGIACTFGIDYQHQAICLDTVPGKFKASIIEHFKQADLRDAIRDILVEFSGAGASSLDYRIYVVIDGQAANAYYRAQRLVAQACVDTCNREGWVIPFTQITVHSVHDTDNAKQNIQTAIETTSNLK
jgi:small-conductance mechanosensitive channel/uncharacterized protein YlxW (UPF0749 family)